MTERPILFSAAIGVRAILAGRKTQTRRLARHRHGIGFLGGRGQEDDPECWGYAFDGPDHHGYAVLARGLDERHDHGCTSIPCPYGEPGDRLWVRETWGLHCYGDFTCWMRDSVRGRSEDDIRSSLEVAYAADARSPYDHWRPGIFMPRWASRITLAVREVRVERLHAITEADAMAEGVGSVEEYLGLWRELHGEPSLATNPWVWVVDFEVSK